MGKKSRETGSLIAKSTIKTIKEKTLKAMDQIIN